MLKINRKVAVKYEGTEFTFRHINGKELLALEGIRRDAAENSGATAWYGALCESLASLILECEIDIDGTSTRWESLSDDEKQEIILLFPLNYLFGLFAAYSEVITPSEDEKKG